MPKSKERVLIVENDPDTSDVLTRQTLQPLGYHVQVVAAASQAIQEAVRFSPDVILADLNLPGLSGKDLLVALSSQAVDVPVIVIAPTEQEGDVIQAFRLGAADYLRSPVREAEAVQVVERVLKQVRTKSERESLSRQLSQTNQELQRRVRELTTIFAIGKAVTSTTDQRILFNKIIEGAVTITEADCGWLLLREERAKNFILRACRNLPKTISDRLNQPWDDGISSLVALSGEALTIHGDPLKRFKVAQLGQSIFVMPVKINKQVVGVIAVMRKMAQSFGASNQALLEAVADYASISLMNVRLFRALDERARSMQLLAEGSQVNEHIKDELLHTLCQELRAPLTAVTGAIDLLADSHGKISMAERTESVSIAQGRLQHFTEILDWIDTAQQAEPTLQQTSANLNEICRQVINRLQMVAFQGSVALHSELSTKPVVANANPAQISKVIEGLLTNAIKFSPKNGQVIVRVDQAPGGQTHISLQDQGPGMDPKRLSQILNREHATESTPSQRFGGLGISLALAHEIVSRYGGKIWVDNQSTQGATFHIMLPSAG